MGGLVEHILLLTSLLSRSISWTRSWNRKRWCPQNMSSRWSDAPSAQRHGHRIRPEIVVLRIRYNQSSHRETASIYMPDRWAFAADQIWSPPPRGLRLSSLHGKLPSCLASGMWRCTGRAGGGGRKNMHGPGRASDRPCAGIIFWRATGAAGNTSRWRESSSQLWNNRGAPFCVIHLRSRDDERHVHADPFGTFRSHVHVALWYVFFILFRRCCLLLSASLDHLRVVRFVKSKQLTENVPKNTFRLQYYR
jgi:hypothetical protein